ncbi:MAG: hypothetical protein EHM27_13225, partial [Deltaproteobacteria bacterium]
MPIPQLRVLLKQPGVKQEEVKWSGIDDLLAGKEGKVTKQEVLAFLDANRIEIKEVAKGEPETDRNIEYWTNYAKEKYPGKKVEVKDVSKSASQPRYDIFVDGKLEWQGVSGGYQPLSQPTKFSQWQLPGGENYRELLFTLPVPRYESKLFRLRPVGDGNYEVTRRDNGSFVGQYPTLDQAQEAIRERDNRPKPFKSPHWSEFNVLAHVRFNERT